ncbi:plastocyanin/azurin family copper-binding protein [Halomarina salina]|uniref:Plastocyanin/azurin family copper-binding protein n=1 Tax=Halomarina salina TaxID=1872699 RepID=A0ABD5RN72_9EURY|nr:plastocyanin/azurin family copper-binding protein [Halomarina salina]
MQQSKFPTISRRNVLKTAGAFSLLTTVGVGTALADKPERKGNNFGNGNGIGAFLNEKALYKPSPIWADGVVDMTEQDTVEVLSGAITNVEIPIEGFEEMEVAPVAFNPMAIKVTPGTTVTWVWPEYPIPIPHDVVSLDGLFNSGYRYPGGTASPGGPVLPDFSHIFDEPGNYLYYCTPHGAPRKVNGIGGEVYNEFGMRGAVIVTDE